MDNGKHVRWLLLGRTGEIYHHCPRFYSFLNVNLWMCYLFKRLRSLIFSNKIQWQTLPFLIMEQKAVSRNRGNESPLPGGRFHGEACHALHGPGVQWWQLSFHLLCSWGTVPPQMETWSTPCFMTVNPSIPAFPWAPSGRAKPHSSRSVSLVQCLTPTGLLNWTPEPFCSHVWVVPEWAHL